VFARVGDSAVVGGVVFASVPVVLLTGRALDPVPLCRVLLLLALVAIAIVVVVVVVVVVVALLLCSRIAALTVRIVASASPLPAGAADRSQAR
jgi:hypothetical protein